MVQKHQNNSPKIKRFRSAFTTEQINHLEEHFKRTPYVSNPQRKELAKILNIPERAVKVWFQNRRMKEKKEFRELDEEAFCQISQQIIKDQLNNATMPSANDPIYLLPSTNDNNAAYSKDRTVNYTSCNLSIPKVTAPETKITERRARFKIHESLAQHEISTDPALSNTCRKFEEISINVCKKDQMDILKPSSLQRTLPSVSITKSQKIKLEHEPTKMSKTSRIAPGDLSNHTSTTSIGNLVKVPSTAANNPAYISMIPSMSSFSPEKVCSSGFVIWKPLNIVPSVPVHLPNIPVHRSSSNMFCRCECHVHPLISKNVEQQPSNLQYIITALPFLSSYNNQFNKIMQNGHNIT